MPQVYRDMRQPGQFDSAILIVYLVTFSCDASMGVIGYLMFGSEVKDEITRSILNTRGYPPILNYLVVLIIAIIPITKIPLNVRPVAGALDVLFGVNDRAIALIGGESAIGMSKFKRALIRFLDRIFAVLVPVIIAIYYPSFESIMVSHL